MIRLQLEVYRTGTACLPECILAVYRVATILGGEGGIQGFFKNFQLPFPYLFQ